MKKNSIKYIKYPLILISAALCISGIRWLISSEPWMLDQIANEERLQMTFIDLFLIDGNSTLSAYLMQIYRFLGLYVLGIGFTLLSFTSDKFLNSQTNCLSLIFVEIPSFMITKYLIFKSLAAF